MLRTTTASSNPKQGCLMHWKSPLFSSFWYVSRVNTTSETDINKPFVWYLAWAKADHTNCLSLFTGDNSSWYFQPDNSWQDKSRFRRNRLQPGTGSNLHNQSWSARRASVVFSDRTWLWWNHLVSFWLIFQCMTDSHLSPLRWSHLVKVTMTGSDVLMSVRGRHLWLWNIYQQPDRAKPAALAAVCAFSHFFRED